MSVEGEDKRTRTRSKGIRGEYCHISTSRQVPFVKGGSLLTRMQTLTLTHVHSPSNESNRCAGQQECVCVHIEDVYMSIQVRLCLYHRIDTFGYKHDSTSSQIQTSSSQSSSNFQRLIFSLLPRELKFRIFPGVALYFYITGKIK